MKTFSSIISLWPKPHLVNFAADLKITQVRAQQMKYRNSIPAGFFKAIAMAAVAREINGISLNLLVTIAEKQRIAEDAKRKSGKAL